MKQVSTKKWLLTASLFAVLAGNYAFQSSSMSSGTIEMSSMSLSDKEPDWDTKKSDEPIDSEMARLLRHKEQSLMIHNKTVAQATQASATTEGADCDTCKTNAAPYLTMPTASFVELNKKFDVQNEKITALILENQRMKDLLDNKVAKNSAVIDEKTKTAEPETDCEPKKDKETRTEKKERELCIKKEKSDKKTAEIVTKFEDKMEKITDKCDKDLECLATEFTDSLNKFDGKNSVPTSVVNKYYKSMISGPLSKALYTDNGGASQALEILYKVMGDMPEKYREIKKITMDSVRYQAMAPAAKIKADIKQAELLAKQNNPQAYLEKVNQIREDQNLLSMQTTAYTSSMEQSLRETGDSTSFNYFQKSYLPNLQSIMNSINGTSFKNQSTADENTNNNSTRNSRNGQAAQNTNQNQQTEPAKMTTRSGNTNQGSNSQTSWSVSNPTNSVQQGPATNNTRGGRGSK